MTTSVRAKFHPSRVKGKAGTLLIRVIHNRTVRQVSTGYKLYPHEWQDGEVSIPGPQSARYSYLTGVRHGLQQLKMQLELVIRHLEGRGYPYTADKVVAAWRCTGDDERSLRTFSHKLAEQLKRTGKRRLSETYTSAVNSLLRFRGEQGDIRRQYLNALQRVNSRLKKIGKMVGCPIPLTTYTARHGWASAAHQLNIATSSISQALGHDSEKTTRIYLDTLDNKVIDEANLAVIQAVYT